MERKKISISELKCLLNIALLDNISEANLLDLCFSCLGVTPQELINEHFLWYIEFFEEIFSKLQSPVLPETDFSGYKIFSQITQQPFVKYYIFEKSIRKELKSFESTPENVLLEFLAIFLDKNNEQDSFNHFERKKRVQDIAQNICATDLYRLYYYILGQINSLKELYPYYFTAENGSGRFDTYSEAKFYSNYALELQLEYIAKLNHCAIHDVYLYPIHEVMLHVSIINQKTTIEYDKISRNH